MKLCPECASRSIFVRRYRKKVVAICDECGSLYDDPVLDVVEKFFLDKHYITHVNLEREIFGVKEEDQKWKVMMILNTEDGKKVVEREGYDILSLLNSDIEL
jgi:hypothetical protein